MILLKGGSGQALGPESTQPISQSTAIVLVVMVIGISLYLWRARYLRSRAALIFVAMIVLGLLYLAVWTNPVTTP
jgi:peptidoglycan/LPS O-acetylase OafA/YrhL